jgi:hypothetical protein
MQTFGLDESHVFEYGISDFNQDKDYLKKQFEEGRHPFVVTCPVWRKNTLEILNGFDENLTMYEDPELHLRSLKKGMRLKFSNFEKADSFYRLIQSKKPEVVKKRLKNSFIFLNKHMENKNSDTVFYFKKNMNELILNNFLFLQYLKFSKLAIQRKVFNKTNVFFGILVIVYHLVGFNRVKGIGYNYLKTRFNNF